MGASGSAAHGGGLAPFPVNVRMLRTERIDGYLTDQLGQPLYMFMGDVAGSIETACLGDCARDWPPFDVLVPSPAPELAAADVTRFHRRDGAWQVTYKGYPLYYRAAENGSGEVTGDGVGQQWFVARDYLAFFGQAPSFAPEGGTGVRDPFLTDGYGRTLYLCLEDKPRTAADDAVSSCDTRCTIDRPVFQSSQTVRSTLLPSSLAATDLNEFVRPDGQRQLTYRGWPLYYYSSDVLPGSTIGHNDNAWRAFDPVAFGL
jgi:predicted lipoprotein with Yx(FWY)xxD motif